MAKKVFMTPFVLLSGWSGGEGGEGGHGSGGTSGDITGCSFAEWLEMYGEDMDLDEDMDMDDYGQWWANNGLSLDLWKDLNPDTPFTWTPE